LEDTVTQVNAEAVLSLLLKQGEQLPGAITIKLMDSYFIAKSNIPNYAKAFACVNQL